MAAAKDQGQNSIKDDPDKRRGIAAYTTHWFFLGPLEIRKRHRSSAKDSAKDEGRGFSESPQTNTKNRPTAKNAGSGKAPKKEGSKKEEGAIDTRTKVLVGILVALIAVYVYSITSPADSPGDDAKEHINIEEAEMSEEKRKELEGVMGMDE